MQQLVHREIGRGFVELIFPSSCWIVKDLRAGHFRQPCI